MESKTEKCANCKWRRNDGAEWICLNEASDNWGCEIESDDSCIDWESRD